MPSRNSPGHSRCGRTRRCRSCPALHRAPDANSIRPPIKAPALKLRCRCLTENGAHGPSAIGAFDLPARDLINEPFGVDADLDGMPDGDYTSSTPRLWKATSLSPLFPLRLWIVKGITLDRASIDSRLAKIQGHDSTKATVRYPYVLAETVNVGRRQLSDADFGLPFHPQPPVRLREGVKTSTELLKSLESGKDLLFAPKAITNATTGSKTPAR